MKTKHPYKCYLSTSQKRKEWSRISQVLGVFRRVTSKFKRDHKPEPVESSSSSPPCPAGKRHYSRCWTARDREASISTFFKSTLSHSVTKVTEPHPVPSTAFVHVRRTRARSPRGRGVRCTVHKIQKEELQLAPVHWAEWKGGENPLQQWWENKMGWRQPHSVTPVKHGHSAPSLTGTALTVPLQHTENYLNVIYVLSLHTIQDNKSWYRTRNPVTKSKLCQRAGRN